MRYHQQLLEDEAQVLRNEVGQLLLLLGTITRLTNDQFARVATKYMGSRRECGAIDSVAIIGKVRGTGNSGGANRTGQDGTVNAPPIYCCSLPYPWGAHLTLAKQQVGGKLTNYAQQCASIGMDQQVLRTESKGYKIEFTVSPLFGDGGRVAPTHTDSFQRLVLEGLIQALLEKQAVVEVGPLLLSSFFVKKEGRILAFHSKPETPQQKISKAKILPYGNPSTHYSASQKEHVGGERRLKGR